MQFYFIRHAQSTNDALWNEKHCSDDRCADPELTETGCEQAAHLAAFLQTGDPFGGHPSDDPPAGFGLTHLYTSLMVRAVETGWAVSQALQLPLRAWEDAYEEGGIYLENQKDEGCCGQSGKNREYFETHYPGMILPDSLGESGWWANRPYEEDLAIEERANRFVRTLLETHGTTDDRVAVISHLGFYNHVLSALLCGESRRVWAVLHHAGVTRIDFNNNLIELVYLNRSDYLPTRLIN